MAAMAMDDSGTGYSSPPCLEKSGIPKSVLPLQERGLARLLPSPSSKPCTAFATFFGI